MTIRYHSFPEHSNRTLPEHIEVPPTIPGKIHGPSLFRQDLQTEYRDGMWTVFNDDIRVTSADGYVAYMEACVSSATIQPSHCSGTTAGERCVRCGGHLDANATCRLVWSGSPPEPDHDAWECAKCTAVDLIARLEAATEGSRELDEAIAEHLLKARSPVRLVGQSERETSIRVFEYPDMSIGSALRYTTSLDAAMTLISAADWDGLDWEIKTAPHRHGAIARIIDMETTYRAEAATPALALCIAALKARPTS